MTDKSLNAKARKLAVLMEQIEGLEKLAEVVRQQIKDELEARDLEELKTLDGRIVRWQTITTTRFDGATFKKALPEIYQQYSRTTTTRRFTLTA